MSLARFLSFAFAAGSILALAPAGSLAQQEPTTSSVALPPSIGADLKEGDTAKDEKTSRAIDLILQKCAAAYREADYLTATGTFIQASKSGRRGEVVTDLHLKLVYHAPDQLRIEQEGKDLHTVFLADGSTVTQLNHSAREFVVFPQPDDLAAFTEEERDGELAEDETNGIANSVIASLLLTSDPLVWLHSNVRQYVYEGVEEVVSHDPKTSRTKRASCWRIKFVQENPDLVVVNWIDQKSFLLRKVSIIQGLTSDGTFTQSYKSATTGRMRITIFDELTTRPPHANGNTFAVEIPSGYEPLTEEGAEVTAAATEGESGWTRLVRAAIAEKGEKTTATISTTYGPDLLAVRPYHEMDSRITGLGSGGNAFGSPALLLASVGKQMSIVQAQDTTVTTVALQDPVDQVQPLVREGKEPLIVVAQSDSGRVRALTGEGKSSWTYDRGATVANIATSRGALPGMIYVSYENGRGVRALDADGKVRHASRRFSSASGVLAAHEPGSTVEVLAHGADEMAIFDWQLKLKGRFTSDLLGGPAEIDSADPQHPIVMIRFSDADDAILQRIAPDGNTSWSLILAPDATDLKGAAVDFARLRLPVRSSAGAEDRGTTATTLGPPERCIFTLLSDGRITVSTMTGDLVYRGQLSAQGTLANRKDQWRTFGLAIQDMDQDGEDEIYTALDASLVQIITR